MAHTAAAKVADHSTALERAPELEVPAMDRSSGVAVARRVQLVACDDKRDELRDRLGGLGYQVVEKDLPDTKNPPLAAVVCAGADPDMNLVSQISKTTNVVLLAEDRSFDFRLTAARSGVDAILWPPFDYVEMGAWLTGYREAAERSFTILIVDDDELTAQSYALSLDMAGMKTEIETDPVKVVDRISSTNPDLVMLDMHMPGVNGLEVARIIRQSRSSLSLPILFVSAERDEALQQLARRIGGDDFVRKPIDPAQLTSLVQMRAERAVALRDVMERDGLTGLLNHARFKERLEAECDRSRRTGSPASLCLIDLDRFKSINDTYGHPVGDRVIEALAQTLSGALRRTDVLARYGGEEFGVLLLDTPADAAGAVMDKIRQRFEAIEFEADGHKFSVTLSGGIACAAGELDPADMIRVADDHLYRAKEQGRNRIVIA